MASYRIKQAAELLGVSDDTVRRWADSGRLRTTTEGSRQVVDGEELARLAQELAETGEHHEPGPGRPGLGAQPVRRPGHPGRARHRDGAGRDPGRPAPGRLADEPRGRRRARARARACWPSPPSSPPTSSSSSRRSHDERHDWPAPSPSRRWRLALPLAGVRQRRRQRRREEGRHPPRLRRGLADRVVHRRSASSSRRTTRAPRSTSTSGRAPGWPSRSGSGAPADVFASASPSNMDTVVQGGDAEDPKDFATNCVEIAVPPDNPAGITALADLAKPGVKVAVCQPQVPVRQGGRRGVRQRRAHREAGRPRRST